jgi:hypothetical protein
MSVKTLARKPQGHSRGLEPGENPFSTNKVTGHSLNVPIIGTCSPTALCGDTCYFARGPATWSASLEKQHRLLNSIVADPLGTADLIASWAVRLRLTFIRWNGGGDLVEETLACIDRVALNIKRVPQWVVSRKPGLAARITPRSNVYVHFSVDAGSWQRLAEMQECAPAELQWFWSYQCGPQETPQAWAAPVIFRDSYDRRGTEPVGGDCPLNDSEDIAGVCEGCRRCFNGTAVRKARCLLSEQSLRQSPSTPAGGGGGS